MSRSQRTTVELLELFVARCRELEEEPLLERHSSVSLTINWDKLAGTKLALDKPPRAELRSALLILRRFVSEREPVHLYRIYNLAYAAIESDELRTRLRESRAAWQNAQESSGISLQADGRAITPERIADLLINGRYFHDDAEKEAELNRLIRSWVPSWSLSL